MLLPVFTSDEQVPVFVQTGAQRLVFCGRADDRDLPVNAVQAAAVALEQLGLLDAQRRELLEPWRAPAILNARGTPAGAVRAVFTLQPG